MSSTRKESIKNRIWEILFDSEKGLGDPGYAYPERAMLTLIGETEEPVWGNDTIIRRILSDKELFPDESGIVAPLAMIGLYPVLCEMLVDMYRHARENKTIFCP